MVRKKTADSPRLLTAVELELMQVLWERGEATVKDVQESLPKGRDLAYTSVATVLKILEKKKAVASRKTERAHLYRPLLSRAAYETKSVDNIVDKLFRGMPSSLIMRLLSEGDFTAEELEAIRTLIEERLGK